MGSSLFRFVVLRPPQRVAEPPGGVERIRSHPFGTRSDLVAALERFQAADDLAGIRRTSRTFMTSSRYVADLGQLSTPVVRLDAFLLANRDAPNRRDFDAAAKRILGKPVAKVVGSSAYANDWSRVADSLLAATLSARQASQRAAPLKRALRILALLGRVVRDSSSLATGNDLRRALSARILLPGHLYPLPAEAAKAPAESTDRPPASPAAEAVERLRRINQAIVELTSAYDSDRLQNRERERKETDTDSRSAVMGGASESERSETRSGEPSSRRFSSGSPFLSDRSMGTLSDNTRDLLKELKIPPDAVRAPSAIAALEAEAASTSRLVHAPGRGGRMVPIGNIFLPDLDVVSGNYDLVVSDDGGLVPAPCAGSSTSVPSEPLVTNPAGLLQDVGIGELMLVEQDLQRYELGEIAHIENVLIGEFKERTHRRTQTTEDTLVFETETVEETERELETTDRFELVEESQKVIKDDTTREAGLTVTGSYGRVDFTADARYARETATEESNSTASTHARDVTERAVSRIEERVREQRTRRTVDVIDESNLHRLDNVEGDEHTIGMYRWLNKVYRAQLVNYGRRALYEFVIPQPAAFLKHSMGSRPPEGLVLEKPDPPGYCSPSGEFLALRPQDITESGPFNYLFWAGRYGAAGVETPPPKYRIVSLAIAETVADTGSAKAENTVQMPPGYLAQRALLEGNRWAKDPPDGAFWVHVGRHPASNFNFPVTLDGEDQVVPVAIMTLGATWYGFTLEVECVRTQAALEAWQLGTHSAIMTAYNNLLSAYNDRLAALQVDEGLGGISGRNPLINRQLESAELKRAAISILTGQHFDSFDAMRTGTPPHGYPQLDLAETAEEGPFIRFFEQAFEWENLVYLFYPYFWGRKDGWARDALLDDVDPLFAQFLRAGAARVVVPARPGFELALASYLQHGWPIPDDTDPALPDDSDQGIPLLSMVDEIKAQQGYSAKPGPGTLAATQGSNILVGTDTEFSAENDSDREIHVDGVKYRIRTVETATRVVLTDPYLGSTATGLRYSLGVRYVGEPWAVTVPTSLVRLQEDAELPVFE